MKIKTFVVNMKKDVHKRALIESQLKGKTKLDVCIFEAVEGRAMSTEEINKVADMESFKKINGIGATLPALGCSLSHWSIYNNIATQNNYDYALILEDDAKISKDLEDYIIALESILHLDSPVVILLTPEFLYRKDGKIKDINDGSLYDLYSGLMTSGYLINKAAAVLLKEKLFPIKYSADDWTKFKSFGLNLYGIVPHIVSYSGGGEIERSIKANYSFWRWIKYPVVLINIKLTYIRMRYRGILRSKRIW